MHNSFEILLMLIFLLGILLHSSSSLHGRNEERKEGRKEEAKKCQYETRNKKEGVNEEKEEEMNFWGKKEREEGLNNTKKNEGIRKGVL